MGWLNPAAGKGIGLYLAPGGTQPQLSVVAVDFLATEPDDNEGFALLYNLDGSPASADFSSARAMVSGHDATRFATFQLEFSAPTDTDRQLTNVTPTARITARAWQVDANNASNQLGRAIELLTDLPPPGGLDHRVGYYAYLGSIFVDGAIGQLDNLVVEGGTAPVPNSRPTIALTSPTNNTEYLAPTNIVIEAEASDSDGEIVDVRFFANSTELGVLTEPPYSVTWTNPPAGTYTLTARATDNRGARTTSAAVAISVRTNNPPTVAVASPANNSTYAAPALIPIEVNAADADGTVTQVRVLVNGSELFAATSPPYRFEWNAVPEGNYELIALATDDLGAETASTPVQVRVQSDLGAPALAIRRETASVVISWPAGFAGFRLEGNTNLASTNWATISTADTSATIPISSAVSRFFRLRRP